LNAGAAPAIAALDIAAKLEASRLVPSAGSPRTWSILSTKTSSGSAGGPASSEPDGSAENDVAHPKTNEVASTEFAVDREIEHR
jgi:hypothetical protein